MTLKEKYFEAMNNYKIIVEDWNTCIEKNVKLPDHAWDKLLGEMEDAKRNADLAWREYLYKEILA